MRKVFLLLCLIPIFLCAGQDYLLKENLERAESGDFVVIAQGNSYTLFHILNVQKPILQVEEITIPAAIACTTVQSWREWVANNAPQNTSWVHYRIDLSKNEIANYYSFTKNGSFSVPEADNFLGTLLKLKLEPIPYPMRRKVGPPQRGQSERNLWQPKMIVDGQPQPGVIFDAYATVWPKDGGPISGKTIEVYLPQDAGLYPAYFPYWLQTKGMAGQANVRVIDSGKGLISPKYRS